MPVPVPIPKPTPWALRVNQHSKVAAGQLNNELKLTIKLSKAKTAESLIILCRFIAMKHDQHITQRTFMLLLQKISIIAILNPKATQRQNIWLFVIKHLKAKVCHDKYFCWTINCLRNNRDKQYYCHLKIILPLILGLGDYGKNLNHD